MHTKSIALLAPIENLPAEGAEFPVPSAATATGPKLLLDFYANLVGNGGLHFAVSPDGIRALDASASVLQFLEVREGPDAPYLDPAATYAELGVAEEEELPLDATSSHDECLRVFLERLNGSLRRASRAFQGLAVPLVRWRPLEGEPGIAVQCLGVWLADAAELRTVSGDGDGNSMALIFENPEIAGRGIQEAVAALAIAGLFFGSVPTAEAGLFSRRAKSTQSEKATSGSKSKAPKVRADVDRKILDQAAAGNTHVLIDISKQRAYLLVNGRIAIDTPVSTARTDKHTPRGEFKITQKVRTGKTSTIYGCDLPCWMRLDDSPIGLHVGDLPGYPASAGCVRLPSNIAPLIFDHAPSGTVVKIVDNANLDSYAKAF